MLYDACMRDMHRNIGGCCVIWLSYMLAIFLSKKHSHVCYIYDMVPIANTLELLILGLGCV
jgi:hypothetical protein